MKEYKRNFFSNGNFSVFKETSIEAYALELKKKFKHAKFIQIIRDPRDNFAAIKSGIDKHYLKIGENYNETLFNCLTKIRTSLTFAKYNKKKFGKDDYHIVIFEELVQNPKKELKKICNFLKIDFDPILLKPTFFGNITTGNNYDGEKKSSISKKNSGRWKIRLNSYEVSIIEFFLKDMMKNFNYKTFGSINLSDISKYYKWYNYNYFYKDSFLINSKEKKINEKKN